MCEAKCNYSLKFPQSECHVHLPLPQRTDNHQRPRSGSIRAGSMLITDFGRRTRKRDLVQPIGRLLDSSLGHHRRRRGKTHEPIRGALCYVKLQCDGRAHQSLPQYITVHDVLSVMTSLDGNIQCAALLQGRETQPWHPN